MSSIVPIFQIYNLSTEERDWQMPHSQNLPEMSFELLSAFCHSVQARAMERYIFTLIENIRLHRLCSDVRGTATHRMLSRWDN